MNGESYEKSIAKLALQSIPTTRSVRGGSLAPEFTPPIEQGPADFWDRLNQRQSTDWDEPKDPAEQAIKLMEENLFAAGGMTKLGAAEKVAPARIAVFAFTPLTTADTPATLAIHNRRYPFRRHAHTALRSRVTRDTRLLGSRE